MKKAYDERRRYLLREFRGLGMDCFEPYGAILYVPVHQTVWHDLG